MPRLDKCLISLDLEEQFHYLNQRFLQRSYSNRFPMLLDGNDINKGKGLFTFENMWVRTEGFVDKVRNWWGSYHYHGSLSYILASKLNSLEDNMRNRSKETFGDVTVWKKHLLVLNEWRKRDARLLKFLLFQKIWGLQMLKIIGRSALLVASIRLWLKC